MLSKLYGECLTQNSNVDPIIIRPHNLYGPRMGMKHVIPQLINRIQKTINNGRLEVFSPEHTRTFCYVDDAVNQIISLMKKEDLDETIYNIGTMDPEIKMLELADLIKNMMDRRDIDLVEGSITQGSPYRRCPDTKRIDNAMQNSSRISLETGVRATLNYYVES